MQLGEDRSSFAQDDNLEKVKHLCTLYMSIPAGNGAGFRMSYGWRRVAGSRGLLRDAGDSVR